MIATFSGFDRLAARLTTAADRIAQAAARRRASDPANLDPGWRWRRAALLWPLFTKG